MSQATEPFYRFNERVGMLCLDCDWSKATINNEQQAIEHLIESGHKVQITTITKIVPKTNTEEPL